MSAERVTPEELAAVLRAEERWENGGSSERHLAAVVMRKAAPGLAREVERLTAERDALRDKARAVCHARRFPATLQHAIDDLAAEVDKP